MLFTVSLKYCEIPAGTPAPLTPTIHSAYCSLKECISAALQCTCPEALPDQTCLFHCWTLLSRSPPGFLPATLRQKPTSLTLISAKAQFSFVVMAPRSWMPLGKLWRTSMTLEVLWPNWASCMLTSLGWTQWTSRWAGTISGMKITSHRTRGHRSFKLMGAWSLTMWYSLMLLLVPQLIFNLRLDFLANHLVQFNLLPGWDVVGTLPWLGIFFIPEHVADS